MPCPYFEPLEIAKVCFHRNARLPLIDEYDGRCHAAAEPIGVPGSIRFAGCNHGNRESGCERFPSGRDLPVLRFTVNRRDSEVLELLAIEETSHHPTRWQTVRFAVQSEAFDSVFSSLCQRAQLLAFCRSYLKKCADVSA